jgi:hypothetical protein
MSPLALQILVCLTAAHMVGDFLLQTDRIVANKHKLGVLLMHAGVVAGLSYLACGAWTTWLIPVAVLLAHAAIDAVKARVPNERPAPFLLDQLAHAVSLIVIAWAAARQGPTLAGAELFGEIYLQAMIVVSGVILGIFAGGVLIGLAVRPLLNQLEDAQRQAGGEAHSDPQSRGFDNGGKLIGQLERALILLFTLTGQPAAVGFLIAAKSIFRFGELRDARNRMEAEYIIIGTLMSFGIGVLAAWVTSFLLALEWV